MEESNKTENTASKLLVSDIETLFSQLEPLKAQKGILWFGISGSWRKTSEEVEKSVRAAVRKIINRGDGIVSGGALNVDYFATDEALKLNPTADRVKVFLPVPLDLYAAHYRRRATEGVITSEQAETLVSQLQKLHDINKDSLISNPRNTIVNEKTYFERNTEVINHSDALLAFQVNESAGVGDTAQKALDQGKPVCLEKFIIE